MDDRPYLSIGEVLALLREEFPDITISKIRFLESQGLLDPERTPSGYRKFYEPDVDRLRWILRQQREHFLPLKVIKGRLAGGPEPAEELEHGPTAAAPLAPTTVAAAPVWMPESLEEESAAPTPDALTFEELASASGLPIERVRELERYGLISGRAVGGTVYYDEECLVVANLAAGFARFGIEARHLRVYKNAAEREAGLLEQVVTPLLKQRNPEARRQAVQAMDDLSSLGERMRAAMLRRAVRGVTGG